jgi:hypothetical protein
VGTKAPCSWFDPETNAVFWDCPGFGDPRGSKSDITNAFSIHELFRPNSKILLVVDASNLKVNKATGFLKLLKELAGLFPDNQELNQSLSMVFSKTSPIQNILNYLRDDILTLNQVDQIELTPDVRGVLNFIVENPHRISSFPCPVELGEYAPNMQQIRESIHSASYMANPRPQIRIFGDSLLYVDSLSDNLNNYITDHVKMNTHTSIVRHCNKLMGNQMLPIEELINTFRSFERNLEGIKNIVVPENPNAFPESLTAIFDNNINVEDIKNIIENIYFLKKIKNDIAYRTADWTNALLPTIGRIQKLIYKLENRKDIQELKSNLAALQEANRIIPELKRGLQELKAENDSLKNQLVSVATNHSQALNDRLSTLQSSFTQENSLLINQISSLMAARTSTQQLKGLFSNRQNLGWIPYPDSVWKIMSFDQFSGNQSLRSNLSEINIPEDGVYSISTRYCFRSNQNGSSLSYTAICIDRPESVEEIRTHHTIIYHADEGMLNLIRSLTRGQKVMVIIFGHSNAEYAPSNCTLYIEKII